MNWLAHREYLDMSVVPTIARARPRMVMSETGGQGQPESAPRVEDIERALVLAREVAAATTKGGEANLRVEHLRALFANGRDRPNADQMQAALEAAGLSVDPPLAERPDTVSLRVDRGRATLAPEGSRLKKAEHVKPAPAKAGRSAHAPEDEPPPRPTGIAAYAAAAGITRRKAARPSDTASDAVTLADAQRKVATEQAEMRTPESIAALMPALILPVLAASFLGPLFGAIFAGLALLTSTLLSRPGALAHGKLGPLRMPASLARSFLLLSTGVAIGALAMSLALIAAGGHESTPSNPNAPIEKPKQSTTTRPPATTTPAAPAAKKPTAAERKAARERRARAERARAERRRARAQARERARNRAATPPSAAATPPSGATTTAP
jgi:hypothetical protein